MLKRGWLTGPIAICIATLLWSCATNHEELARRALEHNQLLKADSEITKAVADNPHSNSTRELAAQIFTREGAAYLDDHQMIEGGLLFQRAIDYDPSYAPAYEDLGAIAFSHHDWQMAIRYGEIASQYSHKPPPAYVQQAREALRRERQKALLSQSENGLR